MTKKFDLNERLIAFAAAIIDIAEALPDSIAASHLSRQIIRSGTSPALNYGEAQGAESRSDFIHKMKISLKELREIFNCLRIIKVKKWYPEDKMNQLLDENNQLISIFVRSIATAQANNRKNNKNVGQ